MVDRVYLGGAPELAASWNPAGIPSDGDRLDTAGLPITFTQNATIGLDNGTASISNPTQFPAGAEAAPITVAAGVELTLRGTIANSNGDLTLGDGAKIIYTNSDDQIQDHGDFDNSTTAPTLTLGLGSVIEYAGTGGSMRITMNGGGAIISDGGILSGLGDGTDILVANLGSDPAQCFCARPLYMVQCKGSPYIQAWGDGSMGDIEVRGLYNIDPVSGGGIRFDGNDDATLHATSNLRIADDIRCEGDPQIRYMQGYTSGSSMRTTGSPLCVDGAADWEGLTNWFVGNHAGSFMRALGSLKRSYFRDIADNPHSISLARLKSQFPEMTGNVFQLDGVQGSSDTGDCFATDAASSAVDYTVAGQEILLGDNLVLPTPHTGQVDGPVFLTMNGHLTLQTANPPKIRILDNTGVFSNGGHALNADEFNTAGATPSDTIIEHKRNVWSNPDSQAPMSIGLMLQGVTGGAADIITLGQSEDNVFHNYPDGLGLKESVLGVNDQNTTDDDPGFIDPTRNLARWAQECAEVTEAEALVNFVRAGFPGYGTTPAVSAVEYDVEKMRQWIRAGYTTEVTIPTSAGVNDTVDLTLINTIDNLGNQVIRIGENHTIQLSKDNVATSVTLLDDSGNAESMTLGTKPSTSEEAVTLPAKGTLTFGGPNDTFIVVNFN